MLKNYIKEASAIIALSILLAFLYNYFSAKPLPIIAEAPKAISNNVLDMAATMATNNTVPIQSPKVEPNTAIIKDKVNKDSLKKAKIEQKLSKDDLQKIVVEKIKSTAKIEKDNLQKTVTYEQVKEKMNDPRFFLIDARNADDYSKSHIGNAINLFPHSDDESKYMEKIFTLPRDKVFIIYCNGGTCDLSHKVAEDMINAGHKNLFIFVGGWEEWTKRGNK